MMRAYSLWQPWASLCFAGDPFKGHETRGRAAPCLADQRVIIHAAKSTRAFGRDMPEELHELCMDAFGCSYRHSLPYGAAIGTAMFGAWEPTEMAKPISDEDRIAGDWSPGRFVSRLTQAREFQKPVPMIGRQGPWTPAEDVSAAIHTQRPYVGEPHFHVCATCFHVWMHEAQPAQSHQCPKCDAGPFTEGWGSYRSAHEAMVALKVPHATASDTRHLEQK